MSDLPQATHDESGLPGLEFDGHLRVLASLPPDPDLASARMFSAWATEMPVIPRNKWVETEPDTFDARILDQDGQGSCTGHMLVTMFEHAWLRAGGQPVDFSACFPYGLCNGGSDRGAIVSDLCRVAVDVGICTEKEVPPGMIFKNRFPSIAWEVAAKFKAFKIYKITNFDELATALIMRWTVGSGIMVGANYADLDSKGFAPMPRGGGGGHARCSHALRHVAGVWASLTQNSWGIRYGMNGRCYEREQMYGRPGTLDAFAIKCVTPDAMDNLPPIAKN